LLVADKTYLQANSVKLAVVAKKFCKKPDTKSLLVSFITQHKAGSPTDSTVFWVSKKPKVLASEFNEKYGEKISNGQVKALLKELGYGYRKQQKQVATGTYACRNEQFNIIFDLVLAMSLQSPVISIDCKKKERLGNFYREGNLYTQGSQQVYDHDYDYLSEGKVIPHGIYDLQANRGYISIGNSAETADFVIDNLRWWWLNYGIQRYQDAKNILVLCDAGGANSYRHHIFKNRLLALAKELNIAFVIAHYPPYASKWNPIEHRLFCHVHKAMSGFVLTDYQTVKQIIENTTTATGLTVVVRLNLGEYKTGIKVDKNTTNRILKNPKIPELSYRIFP
jgi:hypothetical protein